MALDKVVYVDDVTVIHADNLNDIQDEIIQNASDISDKVSKAGDMMTGMLFQKSPNIDINQTQSAWGDNYLLLLDKNSARVAGVRAYQNNGFDGIQIAGHNGNTENALRLGTKSDGSRNVYVTDPTAWRSALELEAVEFNLTRTSAASSGSGVGIYEPGLKTVRINGWAKSDTDIATGVAVFTVPSEYRPSSNKYGSAIIINSSGAVLVHSIAVNASGNVYQSYTNVTRQIYFYIEYKL